MKIITIILTTIILNACGGTKEAAVSEQATEPIANKETTMAKKDSQNEGIQIEYTAVTRGAYKHLQAIDGKINVVKARNSKGTDIDCLKEEWGKIVSYSNNINLDNMAKLEAPSKKSHYDGALSAILKITKNGRTYQSSSFDHGNPPKEIKSLVDYLLTLSKVE